MQHVDLSIPEETKEKSIANLSDMTHFIVMNLTKIFSGSNTLQTITLIPFLMVTYVEISIIS